MQRRFLRVRWPDVFSDFLNSLDHLTQLEVFDLVPAECAFGKLGFNIELYATLITPVLLILALFLLSLLVARCARRRCCSLRALIDWPQIWDLTVWLLLLQFPTISRKTLTVFDCVQFEDVYLLRSDPTLRCFDRQWFTWATIAASGAGVYCLGVPLLTFFASYRFHKGSKARQRLVQILTRSYTDQCWYMESVDLLRKFLLTGVINLFFPQTMNQLWFGATLCLFFLLLHLRWQPFANPICNTVQFAVHVQLVFTYLTAMLFFVEDLNDVQSRALTSNNNLGVLMIGANSVAFLIIVASSIIGARRVVRDMLEPNLAWFDGSHVRLHPPHTPGGYHLFISHVWRYGQDQAGTIKSTLRSLIPSCVTFLDVDDLEDIGKLESYIAASDVILIFLTDKYLSSMNCRRELVAAINAQKPLIVILESDPDKGATNVVQLRAEVDALEQNGVLSTADRLAADHLIDILVSADRSAELPAIIEWHREKELRMAAFKLMVGNVLKAQPPGVRRASSIGDMLVGGETERAGPKGKFHSSRRVGGSAPLTGGLEIFVQPLIDENALELSFTGLAVPSPAETVSAARYVITGPKSRRRVLAGLLEVARRSSGSTVRKLSGAISPLQRVNLPLEMRAGVGIPLNAAFFAFAYPTENMNLALESLNLLEEPWAFLCLMGGFCYFDEALELIGVNSVTFVKTAFCFHFEGPYPATSDAIVALQSQARLATVSLRGLQDQGYRSFAWVHPNETLGGHSLSAGPATYEYGAFAYGMGGRNACFFALSPQGNGAEKILFTEAVTQVEGNDRVADSNPVMQAFASLQKRVRGKPIAASPQEKQLVTLSARYKRLLTSDAKQSVFDNLSSVMGDLNITVTTEVAKGRPVILFLCPGVFQDSKLVDHFERALNDDLVSRRSGEAYRVRQSKNFRRGNSMLAKMTKLDSASWSSLRIATLSAIRLKLRRRQKGVRNSITLPSNDLLNDMLVPMYSTERTFAWYISSCPEHLKARNIFRPLFSKWPTTGAMQRVAGVAVGAQIRKLSTDEEHEPHSSGDDDERTSELAPSETLPPMDVPAPALDPNHARARCRRSHLDDEELLESIGGEGASSYRGVAKVAAALMPAGCTRLPLDVALKEDEVLSPSPPETSRGHGQFTAREKPPSARPNRPSAMIKPASCPAPRASGYISHRGSTLQQRLAERDQRLAERRELARQRRESCNRARGEQQVGAEPGRTAQDAKAGNATEGTRNRRLSITESIRAAMSAGRHSCTHTTPAQPGRREDLTPNGMGPPLPSTALVDAMVPIEEDRSDSVGLVEIRQRSSLAFEDSSEGIEELAVASCSSELQELSVNERGSLADADGEPPMFMPVLRQPRSGLANTAATCRV